MQKTLTLHVSKSLAELWEKLKKKKIPVEEDFKQEMVLSLVRKHRITASRGAEFLGIHYQDFLDLMAENEVPFFDYGKGEVKEEIERLEKINKD